MTGQRGRLSKLEKVRTIKATRRLQAGRTYLAGLTDLELDELHVICLQAQGYQKPKVEADRLKAELHAMSNEDLQMLWEYLEKESGTH